MRAGSTVWYALAAAISCLAIPVFTSDSTALALVDKRNEVATLDKRIQLFGNPWKISATTIDGVFQGAMCIGTSCGTYGALKGDNAAVIAGLTFNVFGGAVKLIASAGVAVGAFDWRKNKRDLMPTDLVYYAQVFEPFGTLLTDGFEATVNDEHHEFFQGARHNCTISGRYGMQQLSRVGNRGGFKLRTEYWHPVKRAPGSIEAYVQEETDNGYPPDNGWLDESVQAFADGIDEYGSDQQAYCVKLKNYLDSTAYMYIAVDGDDTNDQFTSVVGCESASYEF